MLEKLGFGNFSDSMDFPLLLILGLLVLVAYAGARPFRRWGMPSILAYLLVGILLGPSGLGVLDDSLLEDMNFVIQGCLAFIAFRIGLEIDPKEVRKKGKRLAWTTLTESFLAVLVVFLGVWAISGELVLGLAMGALAPASAPAGTLAVIEEKKASGPLTETLYSVVAIDDALGILLFGLILPFSVFLLGGPAGGSDGGYLLFLHSLEEIIFSIVLGAFFAWLFIMVNKEKIDDFRLMLITFGFIFLLAGLAELLEASLILSNMIFGFGVTYWGSGRLHQVEEQDLGVILPFFFLLFFTIAGANLHLEKLDQAGLLALLYIIFRSIGLYGGAFLGTRLAGYERNVRENLGLGLLSQAGVAIGLALIVQEKFAGLGPELREGFHLGDRLGERIFLTVTASSVVFEFIGPLLAHYGLKRAGEIPKES